MPSAAGDLSLVGLAGMLAVTDAFGGIPDEDIRAIQQGARRVFRQVRTLYAGDDGDAEPYGPDTPVHGGGFKRRVCAADDVDVRLLFPDGFVLCAEDDLPAPPREPKRLVKPRNQSGTVLKGDVRVHADVIDQYMIARLDATAQGVPPADRRQPRRASARCSIPVCPQSSDDSVRRVQGDPVRHGHRRGRPTAENEGRSLKLSWALRSN